MGAFTWIPLITCAVAIVVGLVFTLAGDRLRPRRVGKPGDTRVRGYFLIAIGLGGVLNMGARLLDEPAAVLMSVAVVGLVLVLGAIALYLRQQSRA